MINTVFSSDGNASFSEQECQVLGTGKASRRPPEGCAAEREAWGLVQGDGPAGGGAALPLERVQYGVSAAPACSFLPGT